jgi:hypothetical protein
MKKLVLWMFGGIVEWARSVELRKDRDGWKMAAEVWKNSCENALAEGKLVVPASIALNKTERLDAFRHAPEHPLWKAVMDELAIYREICVQKATDPTLSAKETDFTLGGVNVLDTFRMELEARMKQSRKDDGK